MGKHLVIAGAGHAHMTVLHQLNAFIQEGHRVTVIGPGAFHYYSGMGPGMLSGVYRPEEIRFHVKKMAEDRGATFLEGKVIKIDPNQKRLRLSSGQDVEYDVVSFNTGSTVPLEPALAAEKCLIPVKPIEKLLEAQQMIRQQVRDKKLRITVAGGGAAGLEMTGNAWRLVRDAGGEANIVLIAGNRLLARFPDKARQLALRSFAQRQIIVKEGVKIHRFANGVVKLSDGSSYVSDLVFLAIGIRPSPLFTDSGVPTGEDGGLLVNEYLQSVTYPEMFGGGDCISFQPQPLAKVGVYAVRQNPILLHNLRAALNGEPLQKFVPQSSFMLLFNLGDGSAIFVRKTLVWHNRLAFRLKDYIDTKFMHDFQGSGERT